MKARSGLLVAATIVSGVGSVLLLAGVLVFVYFPRWVDEEQARLEALPVVATAQLSDTPSGREVMVEGRIARDQPAIFRSFVAYWREEREQTDGPPKNWRRVEAKTPPLRIEVEDGVIPLTAREYRLGDTPTDWRDPHTNGRIETQYLGLVAGQPVVVIGVAANPSLEAHFVTVGTRDAYLRSHAAGAGVARWLGLLFIGVGALLLLVAAGLTISGRRRA